MFTTWFLQVVAVEQIWLNSFWAFSADEIRAEDSSGPFPIPQTRRLFPFSIHSEEASWQNQSEAKVFRLRRIRMRDILKSPFDRETINLF